MRYGQQVEHQLRNDLNVEFGMELGITQPLSDESIVYTEEEHARVPLKKSLKIAKKMKRERKKKK